MISRQTIFVVPLAMGLLLYSGAAAQKEAHSTDLDGRMKRVQENLVKIAREERAVMVEFDADEKALNQTQQQVRAAKAGLAKLKPQIAANQQQAVKLEAAIRSSEIYAAKRLVALYKLSWVERIQLLATADSFIDFINRKAALEKILGQDEALLETLHAQKTELQSLRTRLSASQAEKRSLEKRLKEQGRKLKARQQKRQNLLRRIRGRKSLELAAMDALTQAALELGTTLKRISEAAPTEASGKEKRPFIDYKGLLRWPVKGKIIKFFGPYYDKKHAVTNFQSGIDIRAERGEPIRAVLDGHAIYARWFKGFGNMIIIDHGNRYHTVYAYLEEIFKAEGDRVAKDEVIATVGDSGSLMGPALHFEVRHHSEPMDPLPWITKG